MKKNLIALCLCLLLGLSSELYAQASKTEYVCISWMNTGIKGTISVIYSDGKIEEFGAYKYGDEMNVKIMGIINTLSGKGYEVVTDAGYRIILRKKD